jgi:hypothetical protein
MPETYKRNQLEQALWQLFTPNTAMAKPPKVFLARIKRLLDLDRELDPKDEHESRYAFFDDDGPGLGVEVQYSPYSAFALALGLDMLDSGFKQSEVLELCRARRRKLERYFRTALKHPPVPGEHVPAEDRPGCPTYKFGKHVCADCWIFMVTQKVEFKESLPPFVGKKSRRAVILEPGFFRGRQALINEFDNMPSYYRKAFVMELAETAVLVTDYLDKAPVIKRGRP